MKYRKKPVIIDAIQWTGENSDEAFWFAGPFIYVDLHDELVIQTLEGNLRAKVGDYIIKGVNGEVYPCKPGIFEKTYERVEE